MTTPPARRPGALSHSLSWPGGCKSGSPALRPLHVAHLPLSLTVQPRRDGGSRGDTRTQRRGLQNSRALPEADAKYTHPRDHTGRAQATTSPRSLAGSSGNSLLTGQELTGGLPTLPHSVHSQTGCKPHSCPEGQGGDTEMAEPAVRAALPHRSTMRRGSLASGQS